MFKSMNVRRRAKHRVSDEQDKKYSNQVLDQTVPLSLFSKGSFMVKTFITFAVVTTAVLSFGTVYSAVTSRDACQVLRDFRRDHVPIGFPRIFHYQSKTSEITEQTKTWIEVMSITSEIQEYPNIKSIDSAWSAVYWSDESCKKLVENKFPFFLRTYNSYPHTIQRVDSCRYLILSTYGGVYADTDISIHASNADDFERLIPDGVGLVESPYRYNEIWQNSLMSASSAGHKFWNTTIEIMMERAGDNVVLSSTGPKMIGDAVDRFQKKYGHTNDAIQGVHTLPCELFQRLPSGNWDTTFLNIIGREILARAIPMQGCGRYGDGRCEICRHTGRASWTGEAGLT